MADDPVVADKSSGGDLGSGGSLQSRTMHPAVVQILRVEGYDDRGGPGSGATMSIDNPHHPILVDSQGRPMVAAAPISVPPRKKTSSFQITSVTVGSRHSNDGGDDSADDLDESHTEDLSSDVLDVSKTTDYDYSSEDAFSSIKDDVATVCQPPGIGAPRTAGPSAVSLFSSAATNATVAPGANVSVTVVESPNVPMSVVQNPDIQWQNRFRVVKIESSEPFRRGRWLCMDFLDPPPPSSAQSEVGDREAGTAGGGGTGSGNSSASSVQHGESVVIDPSSVHNVVASSWSAEPNVSVTTTAGIGNMGAAVESFPGATTATHAVQGELPVYPVSIILQTQQQGNLDFTNTALHMQGRTTSVQSQQLPSQPGVAPVAVQSIPGVLPGQTGAGASASMQPTAPQAPLPTDYSHATASSLGHIPPQSSVSASVPVPSQPGSEPRSVGASLSTTVGEYVPNISQVQSAQTIDYVHSGVQQQQPPPPMTQSELQAGAMPQQVISQQSAAAVQQVAPSDYITPVAQTHAYPPPTAATDYTHSQAAPPPPQVAPPVAQGMATAVPQPMEPPTYVTTQQLPPTAAVQAAAGGMVAQDASAQVATQDGVPASMTSTQQAVHPPPTQPAAPSTSVAAPSTSGTVSSATQEGSAPQPGEEGDPESLRALAAYLETGPLSRASTTTIDPECPTASARKYSASGASTVAIDNKIEQAMDLVKSHLMFAVREEVDVLKEKITELMDRINQLEYENSILKANANQETLAKLARPPATSS